MVVPVGAPLTCQLAECGKQFPRAATGAPARFCSKQHRNRQVYLDRSQHRKRRVPVTPEIEAARRESRKQYMREYWSQPENKVRRQAYAFDYNRRPEVKQRNAERMAMMYADPEFREQRRQYYERPEVRERYRLRSCDPVYRAQAAAAYRRRYDAAHPYRHIEIPAPYTGHRWLEMARDVVAPNLDYSSMFAEDYCDDMGEALLALLEGRDMKEAVKEYRKKEMISRRFTHRMSDFVSPDGGESYFDIVLPPAESAEDEALARETVRTTLVEPRYGGSGRSARRPSRHLHHKTQQPRRRRMKDAGWRKYEHQGR